MQPKMKKHRISEFYNFLYIKASPIADKPDSLWRGKKSSD